MLKDEYADKWPKAAAVEYKALVDLKTWKIVDRLSNKPVVKCRWVFKRKLQADGSLERYKARLVAKGFS